MTPEEFEKEVRRLVSRMLTVGIEGEYFGGFNKLSETGRTIVACARIIKEQLDEANKNSA